MKLIIYKNDLLKYHQKHNSENIWNFSDILIDILVTAKIKLNWDCDNLTIDKRIAMQFN